MKAESCPLWEDWRMTVPEEQARAAGNVPPLSESDWVKHYESLLEGLPGTARLTVNLECMLDLVKAEMGEESQYRPPTTDCLLRKFQEEERAIQHSEGCSQKLTMRKEKPRGVISAITSQLDGSLPRSPQGPSPASKTRGTSAANPLSPKPMYTSMAKSSPSAPTTSAIRRHQQQHQQQQQVTGGSGTPRPRYSTSRPAASAVGTTGSGIMASTPLSKTLSASTNHDKSAGRATRRSASQRSELSDMSPQLSDSRKPSAAMANIKATQRMSWRPASKEPAFVAIEDPQEIFDEGVSGDYDSLATIQTYLDEQASQIDAEVIARNVADLVELRRKELAFERVNIGTGGYDSARYLGTDSSAAGGVVSLPRTTKASLKRI